VAPPATATQSRNYPLGRRQSVRDARWRVAERGARISRRTFWGDGSFDYTPISFGVGADDCVIEDCEFVDCFRGPDAAGGNNLRFINCVVRFTAATALTAQYGFLASAGSGIRYEGCRVEGAYLDSFKASEGVSKLSYIDCHSEGSGAGDSSEGGGWDLYASGDRVQLIGCSSSNANGVAVTVKTHQNLNPPNVVGDVEIVGFRSEGDTFGIALEIVDSVDHAGTDEDPGVRPEAQRINIIGGIIKDAAWNGIYCNTRHVNIVGTQIHGAGREGLYLYRGARDVDISAAKIIACGTDAAGTYAGVRMYGAQRVTMSGGVVDGSDGDTTYHLVPILIANKNEANLVDEILIDKVRMRNWTSTNTMPVLCGVGTEDAEVIVDVWGSGDPGGVPGMHGGMGSTYRRTDTGDVYKKTSAANVKTGWVAL
jgi:hypothetical protein